MKRRALLLLVLAWTAAAAAGQTIYKSVDANGNIVYSDTPVADTLLLETLNLPSTTGDGDSAQQRSDAHIEQMANVTERLKQDREERERARRAEQELEQARQRAATPPLIYREEYYHGYYPYAGPYRGRYPFRPNRQDRPRHSPGDKIDRDFNHDRDLNNDAILVPRSKLLTPGTGR
ncbi:DUF4124 domain-containing protein [Porticoccus sp.]